MHKSAGISCCWLARPFWKSASSNGSDLIDIDSTPHHATCASAVSLSVYGKTKIETWGPHGIFSGYAHGKTSKAPEQLMNLKASNSKNHSLYRLPNPLLRCRRKLSADWVGNPSEHRVRRQTTLGFLEPGGCCGSERNVFWEKIGLDLPIQGDRWHYHYIIL